MKKILSLILTICLCLSSAVSFAAFGDVGEDTLSWAGEAIDYLSEKSVINGYGDGTFRPSNSVTRAEFAKMLSLSFELKSSDESYDDIDGHWAQDYILSAAPMLFTEDKDFNPDDNASRELIAYGLVKALDLKAKNTDVLEKFSDKRSITTLAIDALAAAVENDIMNGYEDNTIRPQAPVTRAEAAALIYRALMQKDTPSEPETPELPSEPDKPENPDESTEHIYSLYPGKNLILISSVATIAENAKNETAHKFSYYLADGEEEYSSVIPDDVKVEGLRSSVSQIKSGDVLIMDTAFHGKIGCLYVLASFGDTAPSFGEYSSYSRGEDYTLEYGKISALKNGNKYTTLTIENDSGSKDINVLKDIPAYVYASCKNGGKWSYEDLDAIDYEKEDVYVFVRYTNGISIDVIISDISR